jgi:hypothetical protein
VMRGMFKLTDFNIRDRYVSYLWPLLVLPWVPVVVGVARNLSQVAASPSRGWARGARLGAACLCCAIVGAAAVGCRSSLRAAVADAQRMREIVREPSQWMNEHLPSQSIVSMEPAGAIRVFTPFTLVDRTGLTTTQAGAFRARVGQYAADDYDAFVTMYQVEYALDYPEFMDSGSNLAREIRRWDATEMRDAPPRICLYRIGTGARSR